MNDNEPMDQTALRSLLLMAELEKGEPISQREIASRLGIALGLVNAYLKTLVKKGFVQVKAYPRNRFAYLLTPRGFTEKSHLAYRHLSNFHKLYRITRQDSLALFESLQRQGVKSISFCGVDDLTEIAYLSLREAGLVLTAVMDEEAGGRFLDLPVISMAQGVREGTGAIFISSLQKVEQLRTALLDLGVGGQDIYSPSYSFEEVLRG
ncbi:MAG: winged helix-turn-helix transcriptional regulator [Desulfuromonadales bacterium]|nr:winged helix-turn-helix transcriptional regulator [Desulfuromonadales bacterium]